MALLDIKFYSQTLGMCVSVNVIMPERREKGEKHKVLWLLHGYSDDHTAWCRNTSIERYAQGKNLCVIMPDIDLSFYTDMVYGNKYYTYISKELPEVLSGMLPISTKKEDNFIAGLSMGGYGTFKLALNQPERFAAAASLSGALDLQAIYESDNMHDENILRQANLVFGGTDKVPGSMNDLRHMADSKKDDPMLPRLYICCGTDDFLYEVNKSYLAHLNELGVPVTYEEEEGYGHVWEYWDLKIQRVLEWMGLTA